MMNATVASPGHDPPGDLYDPDEVLPKNSPLLAPRHPRLSLSPPPALPRPKVSFSPRKGKKANRMPVQPSQGDAVLLGFLDDWRRPYIAAQGGREALPCASDTDDDQVSSRSSSSSDDAVSYARKSPVNERTDKSSSSRQDARPDDVDEDVQSPGMSADVPKAASLGAISLRNLASSALLFAAPESSRLAAAAAVDAGPTPPTTEHDAGLEKPLGLTPSAIPAAAAAGGAAGATSITGTAVTTTTTATTATNISAIRRDGPFQDERPLPPTAQSPFTPHSLYSPREREPGQCPVSKTSPTHILGGGGHADGLPPIQMNSPRSETSGNTPLPSIRSQLGDINTLANKHVAEQQRAEQERRQRYPPMFSVSPPGRLGGMSSMQYQQHQHGSPPVSPADTFRRDQTSPSRMVTSESPGFYGSLANGLQRPNEYTASSTSETPASEQTVSTAPTSVESTSHVTAGPPTYVCKFPGCSAPPFQTQYLLNSHANVHSSERPHYCPVSGCPRGQGGKGFKRKNEMIRHGLVHDSPGYVCPFCPEREHKYPRPDNLQRHVRAHHTDRDKDDPLLRDVLAQRPDGPSRGRRRRAVNG